MNVFKKLKTLGRVLTLVFALLLALLIAATYAADVYATFLKDRLQVELTKVVMKDDAKPVYFYESEFETQDELYDAKMAFNREVGGEGAVLLKNTNNALPLDAATEKNISIFGRSSVDPIKGIEGGASLITEANDPLTDIFKTFNVNVNPTLFSFYQDSDLSYNYGSEVTIGEVPVSQYTEAVRTSYDNYSDAALVMLSRSGTEGGDLPLDPAAVTDGDGIHSALGIQQTERDMIAEAKSCSDKVIVLINSDYAMEIHELKEDPEIDAILWIGGAGLNGIYGSVDVIMGAVNPSGGLADTYAASVASSPAAQGWGGTRFTNTDNDLQNWFTVYQEGIYVGYKYYETRYEDAVMQRYNATSATGAYNSDAGWNYSDEVSYSFGYGLSYTNFVEEMSDLKFDGKKVSVDVKVTNDGDKAGKHIVQVYAQSPYTEYDIENKVEKASVQLMGFAKTGMIEPGGDTTVTVEMEMRNLASYDYTNAKTYILEAGTYYFACGNGAHDALNNILAAKEYTTEDGMDYNGNAALVKSFVQETDDFKTYSTAWQTDEPIANQLDDVDLNHYGDYVTYLSRSDWSGTWPKDIQVTCSDEMLAALANGATYTPTEATEEDKAAMVYDSDDTAYPIFMMRGQPFDSPYWEDILNQLSLEEMSQLIGASGSGLIACKESIVFAGTVQRDGPAGPKANYTEGDCAGKSATTYPSQVVLASTFNLDLSERMGELMGNDGLWLDSHERT